MSQKLTVVGNEPVEAGNEEGTKLFRAFSTEEDFQGKGRYRMHWYCINRKEPIGSYEKLIKNYKKGNSNQELALNECFTENEIKMLRKYLTKTRSRGYWRNLRSIRRTLPIPGNMVPCSRWCKSIFKINTLGEVFIENRDQLRIYLYLYTVADYNLPFEVVGYCHPI